jgi:hypothetical protein
MYKKINVLETPSTDTTIWKYMDIAKFISMLESQTLYFCRSDLLEDNFEGSLPRSEEIGRKLFLDQAGADQEAIERINRRQVDYWKAYKKHVFVNCWHIGKHESYAMWKIYLRGSDGVAIKTTVSGLLDNITDNENVYAGKVIYIDYDEDALPGSSEYSIQVHSYKRKSFEYENEFRLLAGKETVRHILINDLDGDKREGINVSMDIDKMIDEVYLFPGSGQWYKEIVEVIMKKFNLDNKQVRHSKLDSKELY